MQAKVPIVASGVGGIPHVISNEKTGLLLKPKRPEDLAQAIYRLYSSQELKKNMVQEAFNNVCTKYSSKKMASEYYKIYSQIVHHE